MDSAKVFDINILACYSYYYSQTQGRIYKCIFYSMKYDAYSMMILLRNAPLANKVHLLLQSCIVSTHD